MRLLHSLRSRLLLGSLLWTLGLLPVIHVVSLALAIRFPGTIGLPRVIVMHAGGSDSVLVRALVHYSAFLIVALALMAGGFWLFRRGLSPLNQLRARLAAVHAGRERRVEGRYPTEVQPLVSDLNALLDHREQTVRRALAKAGDLAHGLKTPLAVLAHEAERAEAEGHHDLAARLGQQIERMRRQVDYHLAHARAAASGAAPGAQSAVLASAEALARTLQRLHADRGLTIDVNVAPDHAVRAQREDLDEMLGNLLDNACKWARARVTAASSAIGDHIVIDVDDDGPGLAAEMRDRVLQRGVRADEAAPGSGFGLAIVGDLAELYGR